MGSTKIINVLKDDTLKEILEVFRATPAEEVIFVLPKKARAFRDTVSLSKLSEEAKSLGKKVSLLCSDENLNSRATEYGFGILVAKEASPRLPKIKVAMSMADIDEADDDDRKTDKIKDSNEDEDLISDIDEEEEEDEEDEEEKDDDDEDDDDDEVENPTGFEDDDSENTTSDYKIVPTVAKSQARGLSDVIRPATETRNLKVAKKREERSDLTVKAGPRMLKDSDSEIREMWKGTREANFLKESEESSFWDKFSLKSSSGSKKRHKNSDNSKRVMIVLGVASLILISTIVYVSFGSAKINIEPSKQPLNFPLKVTASDKFSSVDSSFNKIPGQLFNIEKSASQTYNSTGQKEVAQKARGQITVYNGYGTTTQILIATTRFQSKEGLIFRTLKTITVPGTKVENGKIIPGSITVDVIADKPGQTYNIEAGDFTIPAFKEKGDNDRYQKITGRSTQAMKGGISGLAKVVTEKDYNSAKDSLTQTVTNQLTESIKSQTAGFKILDSSSASIESPESTAGIDDAGDQFTMTIKGSIVTIGFKQEDLNKLIKDYIEKSGAMTILPEKLNPSFDKVVFDKNQGTLSFVVSIKGDAYAKIDRDKIISDLIGKKENQIKEYFANISTIKSVKVVLSPFWVKKIPKNTERIKLEIIYN